MERYKALTIAEDINQQQSMLAKVLVSIRKREILLLLFGLVLSLGFAFRIFLVFDKHILEYDDGISYLVATGHEGEYGRITINREPPIGTWVSAGDWQRMIQPEVGVGLRQIAVDLAKRDVHPPLYYWMLYGWMRLIGSHTWSGMSLNLLFDLITVLLLFQIAQKFLKPSEAVLVCAIWLFNPFSISTSLWARQYSLFATFALLFVFFLFQTFFLGKDRRPSPFEILFLGIVTTLGLLSHFYFIFFIVLGSVLVALKKYVFERDLNGVFLLGISLLGGGFLFWVIHPNFYQSFEGQMVYISMIQTGWEMFLLRAKAVLITQTILFSPVILALSLLGFERVISCKGNAEVTNNFKFNLERIKRDRDLQFRLWIAAHTLIVTLAVVGIYMAGKSTIHTMSARYVGFLVPLVAFLPVFILRKIRYHRIFLPLFIAGILSLAFATVIKDFGVYSLETQSINGAEVVVVDSSKRGAWPSILLHMDRNAMVFIDDQAELLSHKSTWLPSLSEDGGLYVSYVRGDGSSIKNRDRILKAIQDKVTVEKVSASIKPGEWDVAIYKVTPQE
jgi:hypothetical protein